MDSPDFEAKTVEELVLWLEQHGIPRDFSKKFEENYIDGKEFTKLTEHEVKVMVPPIGLAKKIIRLIPKEENSLVICSPSQWSEPTQASMHNNLSRKSCTPLSPCSPFGSEMSNSTFHCVSDDDVSLSSAADLDKEFTIPSCWPPAIMQCIKLESDEERKRALVPPIRNEIVRVLASNMFCHNPNPKKEFCSSVAKKLVKKYKFLRDTGENVSGFGSWEKKLIEKVHNTKSRTKRSLEEEEGTPKAKRGRPKASLILTRYPPVRDTEDDDVASHKNHEALIKELQKDKPKKEIVLSLARRTYPGRRASVLSDAEDVCVTSLLSEYQEFGKPYVLEQEIDLILEKKGVFESALQNWSTKWVSAILQYSSTLVGKKATLISETRKVYEGDMRDDQLALHLLCKMFLNKSTQDTLVYIYEEYEMTDDLEEVGTRPPQRNAPRICCFHGEETQYFLYVEKKALFSVTTMSRAIIFWFVLHYIFNLEYCSQVKYVALFIQEFVFGLPATSFMKHQKSSTYLTVTTDIQKFV